MAVVIVVVGRAGEGGKARWDATGRRDVGRTNAARKLARHAATVAPFGRYNQITGDQMTLSTAAPLCPMRRILCGPVFYVSF